MTTPQPSPSARIWERIEEEKRFDRFIKRVSVAAWSVTFALVVILVLAEAVTVVQLIRAALAETLPWMSVLGALLPGVVILGIASILIAIVATVGMFFRQRSASLAEIQARLAALEEAVLAQQGR